MKNKAAVHLGRVSAQKRRERLGEKKYSEQMKAIRAKREEKRYPQDTTNAR
jgi:hypothetical protein